MPEQNIRVLVVDDHKGVLENITAILNREPDIQVVGTALDGLEAVESAESLKPDVIIMDVTMPVMDGIRAAGEIKANNNPAVIIMLSMHNNTTLVQQARKNGAVGYIAKQNVFMDLIPAVRAAHKGQLSL